jgi:hypothetical protein
MATQVALKLVGGRAPRITQKQKLAALQTVVDSLRLEKESLATQLDKLENPEQSEVVEAVKTAFKRRNLIAALWGFVKGGFPSLAAYYIAHEEIQGNYYQPLSILVFGALLFSVPTVYEWCKTAFNSSVKAIGFVVLLEGVMVFSNIHWLGVAALTLLIAVNGIQSACNLAIRREKSFGY